MVAVTKLLRIEIIINSTATIRTNNHNNSTTIIQPYWKRMKMKKLVVVAVLDNARFPNPMQDGYETGSFITIECRIRLQQHDGGSDDIGLIIGHFRKVKSLWVVLVLADSSPLRQQRFSTLSSSNSNNKSE